ncbi:MAG: hypothetical protein ACN2B6_00690 [Rickettsiales bacterium]
MSADLSKITEQLDGYMEQRLDTPQQRFDNAYIGVAEIMELVGVSRPAVTQRMNTRFLPVKIANAYFWERSPDVVTFINAWAAMKG